MNNGIVQQVDDPDELYRHPRNTFVAGFIGSPSMNFVAGRIDGGELTLGTHKVQLGESTRAALGARAGDVVVGLRPEDFSAANGSGPGMPAEVAFVESLGSEALVHFRLDGVAPLQLDEQIAGGEEERGTFNRLLVARFPADSRPAAGERLGLAIARERLKLFDPSTGEALN
jgi:multiple sugar transport system ATP-binding protein